LDNFKKYKLGLDKLSCKIKLEFKKDIYKESSYNDIHDKINEMGGKK